MLVTLLVANAFAQLKVTQLYVRCPCCSDVKVTHAACASTQSIMHTMVSAIQNHAKQQAKACTHETASVGIVS